ncbi:DUF481 domain-containing protein [Algoriphagus sediminis]|uniref:DUF481 domain-containing protein n=1 Tax=Algoriphagus sediminis TaxID=3057113 RepID=A0ABT7YER5_9BACT|nr:DUF481 domain-containing protein [Algoriphagus sediminis]MDN3204825.1 DUF481 domain-containing protein [Algoriphagus sediminis]
MVSKKSLQILFFFLIGTFGVFFSSFAQNVQDTVFIENGDRIIGEIKQLSKGTLSIKPSYANATIQLNWNEIIGLQSNRNFIFTLNAGERALVELERLEGDSLSFRPLQIYLKRRTSDRFYGVERLKIGKGEISHIEIEKKGFFNRLDGDVSLGINLAKANKLRQTALRSRLSYQGGRFATAVSFNGIRSTQNETQDISRTDGGLLIIYLITNRWFALTRANFLSNTEQLLDIRMDLKLGSGWYVIQKPKQELSTSAGWNLNLERFSNLAETSQSSELTYGFTFSREIFDKLSVQGQFIGFSGITQKGRFRSDSRVDVKYTIVKDLFLKVGGTYNYDNQPAENASRSDYVIQTTVGWTF